MAKLLIGLVLVHVLVLFPGVVSAQIYADIAVSHGGVAKGTIRIRLDYDKVPRTCANFIGLATGQRSWLDTRTGVVKRGTPYYDGLKFHRLDHNFVVQGGDPLGTGGGGPGYSFQDEFHSTLTHSGRYIVSMANSGTNTNGSQFFITFGAASHLDNKHSVFGEVIDDVTFPNSRALVDSFTDSNAYPTTGTTPDQDLVMETVTISGPSLAGFDINDPALLLPTVRAINNLPVHNPAASDYTLTWDRKAKSEYYLSYSHDLVTWTAQRHILSMNAQAGYSFTLNGVPADRLFSYLTEVDYSTTPSAPADLVDAGKMITINMGNSETVMLTFDGSGGGTWAHSGGSNGSISSVTWQDSAPATGEFHSATPQAKFIPLGQLSVTFGTPAGTEGWHSFTFPVSFHTATSGWTDGNAVVDNPSGSGTVTVNKRVPFTYTP